MLHSGLRTLLIVPLMFLHAAAHSDTLLDIYEMALKNDPVLKAAQVGGDHGRSDRCLRRCESKAGRRDLRRG